MSCGCFRKEDQDGVKCKFHGGSKTTDLYWLYKTDNPIKDIDCDIIEVTDEIEDIKMNRVENSVKISDLETRRNLYKNRKELIIEDHKRFKHLPVIEIKRRLMMEDLAEEES